MTHLLAIVGIVTISFSAIFVRLAGVEPETAAFFRAAYAVPILVVFWWLRRHRDQRSRRDRALAFVAGLFLAFDLAFWHRAIEHIGAGLATVLGNTQVVFVAFLAWILYRERPTRLALVMVPAVFAGVVLITGLGRGDTYGADPLHDVVFGVLTGVSYSVFLLILRRSNPGLAPAAGPLLDATVATALGALLIGLADHGLELQPTWPAHGWLLALALGSQAIGWTLIATALPRLPALETSVLLLLQPTCTVVWAFLLFDERLSALQWTGGALVLLGVGLLSILGSVKKALPEVQTSG